MHSSDITKQAQTAPGNVRISQLKISQFPKIIITEIEELCKVTGKNRRIWKAACPPYNCRIAQLTLPYIPARSVVW